MCVETHMNENTENTYLTSQCLKTRTVKIARIYGDKVGVGGTRLHDQYQNMGVDCGATCYFDRFTH